MRLLLLSDIQGNGAALHAVLREADPSSFDAVLCLGDTACGPNGAEAIARLRSLGASCVRGNMDEVMLDPDGASPPDEDPRFARIDRWAAERLDPDTRDWLAQLPLTIVLDLLGGRRLVACHGSPTSTTAALGPHTPDAELHDAWSAASEPDVLAVGHLHDPMQRAIGSACVLNPGSVGWPNPNPSGSRPLVACYATLNANAGGVHATMHTVRYAAPDLTAAVYASGMPHPEFYLAHWELGDRTDGSHADDPAPTHIQEDSGD